MFSALFTSTKYASSETYCLYFSCVDEFDALQALADLSASLLPGAFMESGKLCVVLLVI